MINASAGGYHVNGITTKVKKIIEDITASERGPKKYGVSTTFNISDLIPFSSGADAEEEEPTYLSSNSFQERGDDAILSRKGPVTRAMSKRLQED